MLKCKYEAREKSFRSGLWEKGRKRRQQPWLWRAPLRSVHEQDTWFESQTKKDKWWRKRYMGGYRNGDVRILRQ